MFVHKYKKIFLNDNLSKKKRIFICNNSIYLIIKNIFAISRLQNRRINKYTQSRIHLKMQWNKRSNSNSMLMDSNILKKERLLGDFPKQSSVFIFLSFYGKRVNRNDFTCALSKSMLMLMFTSV